MIYEERKKIAERKLKKAIKVSRKINNPKRMTPSPYSKNTEERKLGEFLQGLKYAKNHPEKKTRVFYPSLDEILIKENATGIIKNIRTKENALAKLKDVIDWIYENKRLPRSTVKNPKEKKHYVRLQNLKSVKCGKLQGVWYTEYDDMIRQAGYENYFGNPDQQDIKLIVEKLIRFYKKNKRIPTQKSEEPDERILYRNLIRCRQIKQGKTAFIWDSTIDEIFKHKKIKNFFNVDF